MNTYESSSETDETMITLRIQLAETESKFIQNAVQAAIQAYRYTDARRVKKQEFLDGPKQEEGGL